MYSTTGAGGTGGSACNDDPWSSNPTCGWAHAPDANGNIQDVPCVCIALHCIVVIEDQYVSTADFSHAHTHTYRDSQGFCCKCPTLGGDPIYRGYRSCNWSPGWAFNGVPGSAHCLRYDDYWWYRGYVIGTYQLEFDIQVYINTTVLAPAPTLNSTTSNTTDPTSPSLELRPELPPPPPPQQQNQEVIAVNPSRGFVLNADKTVSVRLNGDLDAYRQIQSLDGSWLLIPLQPGLSPNEFFTSNLDMWVVLPPNMVTITGECNKVGVDYTAFRTASERCGQPLGSCLRNQLWDLEQIDNARIQQGMEPLYNITRYGGGWANQRQIAAGQQGGGLSLRLPLKGVRTSLVTVEVAADDVQLVTNRAAGKIVSSLVCTFDKVLCGGFTAISGTGFLSVTVQNTGAAAADFRAGVLGCSRGVLPIVEEYSAILPGKIHEFVFVLRMGTDQANGNVTCTVVVTDSAGDIADSSAVSFYTNATQYQSPPDQSDLGDKVRFLFVLACFLTFSDHHGCMPPTTLEQPTAPGYPPRWNTCAKKCPNLLNVKCLIVHWCWKRLMVSLVVFALIAASVTFLWVAFRRGWISSALKCCCRGRNKGGHGGRDTNEKTASGGGNGGNGGNGGSSSSFMARSNTNGAKTSSVRRRKSSLAMEPHLDDDIPLRTKMAPMQMKNPSMPLAATATVATTSTTITTPQQQHRDVSFGDSTAAVLAAKHWYEHKQRVFDLQQEQPHHRDQYSDQPIPTPSSVDVIDANIHATTSAGPWSPPSTIPAVYGPLPQFLPPPQSVSLRTITTAGVSRAAHTVHPTQTPNAIHIHTNPSFTFYDDENTREQQ